MRYALTLLAVLVSLLGSPTRTAAVTNEPALFLAAIHTNSSGSRLPYRLLIPKDYAPGKLYPLVVFLHGAIARGDDNEEPLNWGPKLFLDPAAREQHPCFLLVPQCPKGVAWSGSFFARGGNPIDQVIELVRDRLPKQYGIDTRRRYLTGVSMGGIALWGYMSEHPGFFAAGVPVCAAGTPSSVTREAARYPMWVFHSDDDHLIAVQSARDMVKAWQEKGGTAKYTEYTGLRHSSWKKAYLEPGLFPWLFEQRLPELQPR